MQPRWREPGWSDTVVPTVREDADNWYPNDLFCIYSCNTRISGADNQTYASTKSTHPMIQNEATQTTNHTIRDLQKTNPLVIQFWIEKWLLARTPRDPPSSRGGAFFAVPFHACSSTDSPQPSTSTAAGTAVPRGGATSRLGERVRVRECYEPPVRVRPLQLPACLPHVHAQVPRVWDTRGLRGPAGRSKEPRTHRMMRPCPGSLARSCPAGQSVRLALALHGRVGMGMATIFDQTDANAMLMFVLGSK